VLGANDEAADEEDPVNPGTVLADAADDQEVESGDTVRLDGSQSTGTGPEPLEYEWTQVMGPPVILFAPSPAMATFVAPETESTPLVLEFELTVRQGDGEDRDQVRVVVMPQRPEFVTADAGPDESVEAGQLVTLDGSASDGSGPLEFQWTQLSGEQVLLSGAGEARATFLAPDPLLDPLELTFELAVRTGELVDRDEVTVTVQPPPVDIDDQMAVLDVQESPDLIVVTTTGGRFTLTAAGLEMERRIDPAINAINPRLVARLTFTDDPGAFQVASWNSQQCLVAGDSVELLFQSDSVVRIDSIAGGFGYVYESLLEDPPWTAGGSSERFWTDGYGGSSHASNPHAHALSVSSEHEDGMDVLLHEGGGTVLSVFPPRFFDYGRLYDQDARPHIYGVYSGGSLATALEDPDFFADLRKDRFGVLMVWHGPVSDPIYPNDSNPVWLSGSGQEYWGYEYVAETEENVRTFVARAHAEGFKVIAYLHGPKLRDRQPPEATLQFMADFREEYGWDGFVFDNANAGQTWLDSYEFVRKVRQLVGPDGIMINHDTLNLWGDWSGRDFPAINAYMTCVRRGETGCQYACRIENPFNAPYYRYYACQIGLSNALWWPELPIKKWCLSFCGEAVEFGQEDLYKLSAELHGVCRGSNWLTRPKPPQYPSSPFRDCFLPAHQKHMAEWQSGTLDPDVAWPMSWPD